MGGREGEREGERGREGEREGRGGEGRGGKGEEFGEFKIISTGIHPLTNNHVQHVQHEGGVLGLQE